MKLFKNYEVLSKKDFEKAFSKAESDGKKLSDKANKARIESLEQGLERKEKLNQKTSQALIDAKETIDVYEELRDKTRDVIKQSIENDDMKAVLDAREDGLDTRTAHVKDLESKLDDKTDSAYKGAYADGAADMARKIGDITQKDRDNAMKIAMVSAASHTNVDTMKEINSEYRLTEGTSDKKS